MSIPGLPKLSPALATRVFVVLALMLLANACGDSSTDDDGAGTVGGGSELNSLTGDINIEGALELSHIPPSQIVVRLEDISLQDVSSVVIAERVYEDVTTLPLTYELTWAGELDPRRDYSVGARVYDVAGELIFVTDTVFPVFPGDDNADFHIISVH